MFKNKINIKNIIVMIVFSSLLGFGYNILSPDGLPFIYEEKQFQEYSGDNEIEPTSAPLLITLEQTMEFYEKGHTFIDARDRWDFAEGRIKGAINIPEYSFRKDLEVLAKLDKSSVYIIYCGGDDCDTSKRIAKYLTELNFEKLFIYSGGYFQWRELGLPIETDE